MVEQRASKVNTQGQAFDGTSPKIMKWEYSLTHYAWKCSLTHYLIMGEMLDDSVSLQKAKHESYIVKRPSKGLNILNNSSRPISMPELIRSSSPPQISTIIYAAEPCLCLLCQCRGIGIFFVGAGNGTRSRPQKIIGFCSSGITSCITGLF